MLHLEHSAVSRNAPRQDLGSLRGRHRTEKIASGAPDGDRQRQRPSCAGLLGETRVLQQDSVRLTDGVEPGARAPILTYTDGIRRGNDSTLLVRDRQPEVARVQPLD